MTVTLKHPLYAARVVAPTSKSAAHRALICAAFADRKTHLPMRVSCDDIDATAACLTALGATVTRDETGFTVLPITPSGLHKNAVLDCGESGTTLRLLLPVCLAIGANASFMRRGRLPQRPLSPLKEVLEAHGASFFEEGALLHTKGQLRPGGYSIAANVSSQFVSGLLLALSLLKAPSTLALTDSIESAPYIEMTCRALADFGAAPKKSANGRLYEMAGLGAAPLTSPGTVQTEGDFSGAAFPLALGSVGSHPVTVTGLSLPSLQGDSEILTLLARFGARVEATADAATVFPAPLRGISIDATHIPDLVPVLAVVAAAAAGETRITGAARLRLKESDRIASVGALLRTLGADVTETNDGLIICGGKPLCGGQVDTYLDHRIAMSAAVAAVLTDDAVVIPNSECVQKSYPTFFDEVLRPMTRKEQQ